MYDKAEAVDTYLSAIKFVPECNKTQKMSHRAVHKRFFVFGYISDKYKTQEICNLHETVDDFLATLKLFAIGLLQSKWLKNFLLLCMQMKIYSISMKILVMLI